MGILRLIALSFILLLFSGCDTLNKYPPIGDTVIETPGGEKYSCVTDTKTCIKTCDMVRKDGLKIKQTFKMDPDICKIEK